MQKSIDLVEPFNDHYEIVIGLEVHVQLLTLSKAFASDANQFGGNPNQYVGVITMAHPGAMPRSNTKMFEFAVRLGLACESEITRKNIFARKNYFYPDLPKGYQITQDKGPVCVGGRIPIRLKDGTEKDIPLHHIHLEEDAGKSIHTQEEKGSLIDLNRAGVPLLEIVSEPALHSAEEAYSYLTEIRRLVRYLEICDGNMEEGSLRCDVNISVRKKGEKKLGTRVEIKNLNSFRNIGKAIQYESNRQIQLIEAGRKEEIVQETRLFDPDTDETKSMRSKENLNDYRYFPEPDLCPVLITDEWLAIIRKQMPPLPQELRKELMGQYGLSDYDANQLTAEKETALYFKEICQHTKNYKAASNWMNGTVKNYLNEQGTGIEAFPLQPSQMAALILMIDENMLSNSLAAQKVFPALCANPSKSPKEIAMENNWLQQSDEVQLKAWIEEVLLAFPDKVEAYQKGKKGLMGMLMGEVMKKSKGKADPKIANRLMLEALGG